MTDTPDSLLRQPKHFAAVRLSTYSRKKPEVIFDFANDWHCALKLEVGMTKQEVAEALINMGNLIYARKCEEDVKPVKMPSRDNTGDYV
jgi:hypothetical protein